MHTFLREIQKYLTFFLNPLFKMIVILFNLTNRKNNEISSVLIIKFLGGGSLYSFLPFLISIKKKNPNIKLKIITSNYIYNFVKTMNIFDEIHIVRFNFLIIFDLIKIFFRTKTSDAVLSFEVHSHLVEYLSFCFSGKKIIPTYENKTIYNKVKNIDLLKIDKKTTYPVIYQKSFEKIFINLEIDKEKLFDYSNQHIKKLYFKKLDSDFILLAPFSSQLSIERNLSFEEIKNIIQKNNLSKKKFILIGGNEKYLIDKANKLCNQLKNYNINILNELGKNSLEHNINLSLNAYLNIVVDSGFNHIIRLTTAKIISFWGPTNPSMQCLKLPNNENLFYKAVKCSPCVHFSNNLPCGGYPNNFCMKNF